ncbi:MAG: RagB/SusD family nutrient uptake outer membrane protein [Dysgonamonadaceae bacterium]|jgi:hypothetical protein|nr:RagB/SusD family nutrient uptake outer membrane protein [Dysgonamonadaceae bacterium]
MKNKLYYLIAFVSLAGFTCSCDYLDKMPDDELTFEMVFNNKTHTEEWLAGIYSAIPRNYMNMLRNYDIYADDYSPNSGWEAYGWDGIGKIKGNWSASSAWEGKYWEELPKRIRAAYLFIDNVKPLPEEGLSPEEVTRMKAECQFLIAYFYYLMVNTYGAIPLQVGAVDIHTPVDQLLLEQLPYDKAINWVDSMLVDAAERLPAVYNDNNKYGRATSVMCYAVRARMLLFAASPLVNGNQRPQYVSYTNAKGEPIFNSEYDAKKWERAAKACEELITLAHKNEHALYTELLSDGTIDPFMSYMNMSFADYNTNKEILFGRGASDRGDWYEHNKHATPFGLGGNGGLGVTQSLVDAFFMDNGLSPVLGYEADGKPILNPETQGYYRETGFSADDDIRPTRWFEAQGGEKNSDTNPVTNAGTFNMYCHREPRFYISVLYNEEWLRVGKRPADFFANGKDNVVRHDSPETGYLLRKRVHPDTDIINGSSPDRPPILYRLGEAYLNYAEALNEWQPDAKKSEILLYLNKIRERAGIPQYGTGSGQIAVPADQAAMREAIYRERRVEMNCEFAVRFDDIRRWDKVEYFLNGDFYGMNRNGTVHGSTAIIPTHFYVRKPYITRGFTWKNSWFPIRQEEIDRNPYLRQVPGW